MALSNHDAEPWFDWIHPSESQLTQSDSVVSVITMMKLQLPDWSKGKSTKDMVGEDLFASLFDNFMLVSPWSTPKMRIFAMVRIIQGLNNLTQGDRYTDA